MLHISEIRDRPSFISLEKEWNALVERSRNEVHQRHEFWRTFLDSFFKKWPPMRIFLAREDDGRLQGVLPLLQTWSWFYGFPVRRLGVPSNYYFTRFDLIAADPEDACQAFLSHLAVDPTWDVLRMKFIPADSDAWGLRKLASQQHFDVASHLLLESPLIRLPASMDALLAGLKPKFRANLRRRRAHLASALGPIELEKFTSGPDFKENLAAGFAIEKSGWKGKEKSAILSDPPLLRFLSDIAAEGERRGYLMLYFLKVGGRRVAFHYGLAYNRRYLFIKPGYDETLKEYGPGHLLVEEVLRDCIANGFEEFDFLAENMPWKEDWTLDRRPHHTVYIFKNSAYGHFLTEWKASVPRLKRLLRWRPPPPTPLAPTPA